MPKANRRRNYRKRKTANTQPLVENSLRKRKERLFNLQAVRVNVFLGLIHDAYKGKTARQTSNLFDELSRADPICSQC